MFSLLSGDGIRLAVYDYRPDAKKTVLLLHGWPFSHEIFEYQILALTGLGYRVIAPDFRGFGASDSPVSGYGYDQLASDLYGIVASLNLFSFTLAGFSMGGAVALRYMRLYGGYGVKKLILAAAVSPSFVRRPGFPGGIPLSDAEALVQQAKDDRPALVRRFCQEKLFARPHSQAKKDWLEHIARSASAVGTVQAACALRDEDGRADLAAVTVPTFLLHGKKDAVAPKETALTLAEEIPGARLFWMEQSGHGIFSDDAAKFNRIFFQCL